MGRFASAAHQTVESIDDLKLQMASRKKAEVELHKLTDHLEEQFCSELLKQWVTHWNRPSYLSMEALVELFGQAPRPLQPEAVAAAKVRAAHHALLARCGLNMVEI
jgi:hypothetical protein